MFVLLVTVPLKDQMFHGNKSEYNSFIIYVFVYWYRTPTVFVHLYASLAICFVLSIVLLARLKCTFLQLSVTLSCCFLYTKLTCGGDWTQGDWTRETHSLAANVPAIVATMHFENNRDGCIYKSQRTIEMALFISPRKQLRWLYF